MPITNGCSFCKIFTPGNLPAAATGLTGFDLYLLRESTVEEFPDSVVLKEPEAAAIVADDVVV